MRFLTAACGAALLLSFASALPAAEYVTHDIDRNEIASVYTFVTADAGFDPARTLEAVRDALLAYRPATDLPESAFPKMTGTDAGANVAQIVRLANLVNDHLIPSAKPDADVDLWIEEAMTDGAVLDRQQYSSRIAGPLGDPARSFGFTARFDRTGRHAFVQAIAEAPFSNPAGLRIGDEIVSIDGVENPYATDARSMGRVIDALASDAATYVFKRDGQRIPSDAREIRARYSTVDETRGFGGVTYVHMNGIGAQSGKDMLAALSAPELAASRGLVLDLRDTEAGTIDEAVAFVSHFTKNGIPIGTYVSHTGTRDLETVATPQIGARPIVVICDSLTPDGGVLDTVARVLKAQAGAQLVGTRSRGIRAVRDRLALRDGSGMTIVSGHVYFPGETPATPIGKRALVPDLFVDRDDSYDSAFDDPRTDPQLKAALMLARERL